MLAQLLQPH